MDMLNYRQISERFPICNNCVSSNDAWALMLKRWREEGKLKEKRHWRYGPSIDGGNQPTRLYDLARVVRLVVLEHQGGHPRPRIAFLCQTYTDQLADILTSVATVASDDEQAVTP